MRPLTHGLATALSYFDVCKKTGFQEYNILERHINVDFAGKCQMKGDLTKDWNFAIGECFQAQKKVQIHKLDSRDLRNHFLWLNQGDPLARQVAEASSKANDMTK
jgi:hypothetical protein